ncbi:MAG: alpha/beta hydrolase, partial [Pseudomonadota bacterium]|nr:alpha/beta hydrolase [Pseudomonadota bacterium]
QDGLKLHARHYPARDGGKYRPLLCLPGLTRNGRDFEVLAAYFSTRARRKRDVYCLDYRGRGLSEHDRNWRNYTPYIETVDVLDFTTSAGIHDAAVIGTSRGGIVTMLMAVMRPTVLGAAVLNDIGPIVETAGLARIIGYVGRVPSPASWDEAAALVKGMNGKFFPDIADAEWPEIARQWFSDREGTIKADYDLALTKTMSATDLTRPVPSMWSQFSALGAIPLMTLRGETSDLLSEETLSQMAKRNPAMRSWIVEGQGHAPMLRDDGTLKQIESFLDSADRPQHH